jgi:CHRD domain-containing protein
MRRSHFKGRDSFWITRIFWRSLLIAVPVLSGYSQGSISFGTNIYAYLSGLQEVPRNDSMQYGGALLTAYYSQDASGNTPVDCRVDLPLSFAPSGAAIYGPANTGQNGSLIFDLGSSATITNVSQVPFSPPVTNISLVYMQKLALTPSQLTQLYQGLCYINVWSAAYPQGELRGQLNNRPVLLQPVVESQDTVFLGLNVPGYINYQLQVSTNLIDWYAIGQASLAPGPSGFTDQHDPNEPRRFYRLKVQ